MTRLLAVCLLLLVPTALLASEFSSLEERMSAAEFRAAGLDKLSPAELEALNQWLRTRGLLGGESRAPDTPPAVLDRTGFRDAPSSGPIVSRIRGNFRGWSGNTVFELENGQVWRQADGGAPVFSVNLVDPVVTIREGVLGGWLLSVEGYNRSVRVVRVR